MTVNPVCSVDQPQCVPVFMVSCACRSRKPWAFTVALVMLPVSCLASALVKLNCSSELWHTVNSRVDMIMVHHGNLDSAQPLFPVAKTRQLSCTHISMTRLYDTDGPVRCQLCHNHPNFGWVYQCVQDYNGYLPTTQLPNLEQEPFQRKIQDNATLNQLSLSILKAIERGCYTDEQIGILTEQKETVRRAVLQQARCEQTPSSSTSSEDNKDIFKFEEDFDNTATTVSSMAQDEELPRLRSTTKRLTRSIKGRLKDMLAVGGVISRPRSASLQECHPSPTCDFAVCHKCRPMYRDRAYGSLNHILASDLHLPPIWELENKPIADARVVSQVGLSTINKVEAYDPPFECDVVHSQTQSTIAHSDSGRQIVHHSIRSRSGFRATVRKALEQAVHSSQSTSSLPSLRGPSNNSSLESFSTRFGRTKLFWRKKTRDVVSAEGLTIDSTQLQDALLLKIAINTPLPGSLADTKSSEERDTGVESGRAGAEDVTSSSTADVIAQS